MNKILLIVAFLLAACAPNPNGVSEGEWVRNKVTGEEHFLVDYNQETGDVILAKNREGEVVEIRLNILELEPLVNAELEEETVHVTALITALHEARLDLAGANTPANRSALQATIEVAEEEAKSLSPVFKKRTWNHATGRYED